MELVRLRMVRMSSQIPDTLYMIDDTPAPPDRALQETGQPSATNDLDVVTGAVPGIHFSFFFFFFFFKFFLFYFIFFCSGLHSLIFLPI